MTASKFSRKNREDDEHARLGDVESPGSEDAVKAAPRQHTEDIGEKGTITQLDTARDKCTST